MSHGRLTELFIRARELPESERATRLDEWCRGEPELREQLDSLLSHEAELTLTDTALTPDPVSQSPQPQTRFLPGAVLAGRFRVVALLGRGGMGEVYRAEDLKLDQPVALKFLPRAVEGDPLLLERLIREVRIARQVTHPNVCRVFDVGEAEGRHFFAMEYIDGEDLGTLLRRIGRVPRDKAVQIARQLAAGLAAAHDCGILHRDLKPANVMIDGRGRAKITDFGLAAIAGRVGSHEIVDGTPAYMAPEQLAGLEVTPRSDLYALGLVLYELFTGVRAFSAATAEELRRIREETTPRQPSLIVDGLDPAVERAILECLEPDPRDRPPSALALLAALPGADALAAALAANHTPSPELVAAAEAETGVTKTIGVACVLASVIGLILLAWLSDGTMLFRRTALELSPAVLAHIASETLAELGHPEHHANSARGFGIDAATLGQVEASGIEGEPGDAPALYFWYRTSPEPFRPQGTWGNVDLIEPPSVVPGMASVILAPDGRLLEMQIVAAAEAGPGSPNWDVPFSRAGLDVAVFDKDEVRGFPSVHSESHHTWRERSAADGGSPLRVRAGSLGDRVTYFQVLPPWRDALLATSKRWQRERWFGGVYDALYIVLLIAFALAARHNLRHGRGDRRGANRLAVYVFVVTLIAWLLLAEHAADLRSERLLLIRALGGALFAAVLLCWVPYVALEPALRRAWPHRIVSWARILAGRFRDPLVGRDLMLGVLIAVIAQLLLRVYILLPGWLGLASPRPEVVWPETLLGLRQAVGTFLRLQPISVFYGFGLLFLLLSFRVLTRSLWIATPVVVLLGVLAWHPEVSELHPAIGLFVTGLRIAIFAFAMLRFGVLAGIVAMCFDFALNVFPLSLDFSAWYVASSLFIVFVALGTSVYGLRCTLAGRAAS